MDNGPLHIGIAGLGAASTQILPAFRPDAPFVLAAGADHRLEARQVFESQYDRPAVENVEALCRRNDVDAIWIATPNTDHAEHAVCAAKHGKHIICEKPMAVTLKECDRMIKAAEANNVLFLQGHSKIYQAPIRAIRDVIKSGRFGRVIQIQAFNSNDWLQRPRLLTELDTEQGGGLVYRQGSHMVDIVRFIGGGKVRTVRGVTGRADPNFDTEGHFSALLEFEDGAVATLTFNGYGYFDIAELTWDIGEGGLPQTGSRKFPGNPRLKRAVDTDRKKDGAQKRLGTNNESAEKHRQPFFGLTVVACERGVIRQSPDGLYLYSEDGREEIQCLPGHGRAAELRELAEAVAEGRSVFPDGHWGKATLEVCLAIMDSSRDGGVQRLRYQVSAP